MDPQFVEKAKAAGFTDQQAAFFWEFFALDPHTHTTDDIFMDDEETISLTDELAGGDEDEDEDEDEEA